MKLIDIKSPQDLKPLSISELEDLGRQMREATLKYTSAVGGHVGPNLGDIEAVLALHYVFDAPKDKIVFDVSHQDFAHKMLTGRAKYFLDPSLYESFSEYTDPKESPEYDIFYAGHTSPSASLCFGLAKARDLKKDNYCVIDFIGDGSLSGGVAFEGLDAAAKLNSNFIVIVNDNQMAIAENHGGLYDNLRELRETNGTAENNFFKTLVFDYIFVKEGNNLEKVIEAYESVKNSTRPVVVHLNTQKGEGYAPAEEFREEFHYRLPYQIESGDLKTLSNTENMAQITRDFLLDKVKKDPTLLVITSATPESFDFMEKERQFCGNQFVDVAIAEQTGVSTMAGAARGGIKVIYPVVGTFLQRAFDQLEEDWAMNASPAVMPVLETGINGIRDLTHLGFWDIPYITAIPEIVYLAPTNVEEYLAMMDWALRQNQHKVAIRVPTYSLEHADGPVDTDYDVVNTFKIVEKGTEVAIIAAGDFFVKGKQVSELLKKQGIQPTLINPRFISGVDKDLLKDLEKDHEIVVVLEDGSVEGGFGSRVAQALGTSPLKTMNYGLAKKFVNKYDVRKLEQEYRLLPEQIVEDILAER